MKIIYLKSKPIRYIIVGISATFFHLSFQFILLHYFPLWISNTVGFFAGSLVSYFGHALFTFQEITAGSIFARRWLFLQFSLNITLAALVPFLFSEFRENLFFKCILVVIPIFLNFIIWSMAADFMRKRKL